MDTLRYWPVNITEFYKRGKILRYDVKYEMDILRLFTSCNCIAFINDDDLLLHRYSDDWRYYWALPMTNPRELSMTYDGQLAYRACRLFRCDAIYIYQSLPF